MAENIVSQSGFDSIRRVNSEGVEYWIARELQTLLGYVQWRRFEESIDKAKVSCKNSGTDAELHFQFLPTSARISKSGKGRLGDDYKLSRHACYLTAMCGDPRKPEIAAAQSYFAVKTHEAETVIPKMSEALELANIEMEKLKLQLAIATQQNLGKQLDSNMLTMHGASVVLTLRGMSDQLVEVTKPTIEVIDEKTGAKFAGQTLVQIKDYIETKYGFKIKSGAEVKRRLEAAKRSDLIAQMKRPVLQDYIPMEYIEEAIAVLTGGDRQLLLGE